MTLLLKLLILYSPLILLHVVCYLFSHNNKFQHFQHNNKFQHLFLTIWHVSLEILAISFYTVIMAVLVLS